MPDEDLAQFVQDGLVQAAASMFPVELIRNSVGRSPVRLMLLFNPTDGSWWVAAWASSARGGSPERLLLEKITDVHQISVSRVSVQVQNSQDVLAVPSGGGCCGNRLKSWNPFGEGVTLAHRPYSGIETQ